MIKGQNLSKCKYLLKILIFNFCLIGLIKFKKKNEFKICLCTIGKKENLYVKEYVKHYLKYKIDKIFIYDNNDINGEVFDDVISNYIKKNYVEIINYRGRNKSQLIAMNDCYKKNYKDYNWLIFYDMDEFIYLKDYDNLKDFLNLPKFNNCEIIQLNWVQHTDNNLIYYNKGSLAKRFKEIGKKINGLIDIKSMIRGNITTNITSAHFLNPYLKCCNGFGKKKIIKNYIDISIDKNPDYKYYYIDHYYTKSTEEYINKITKGSVASGAKIRDNIVKLYFELNKITSEKIDYLEKKISINLSKFRNKIQNIYI